MIHIEEDKQFLLPQREKGRPGRIGCFGKAFAKKEAESEKKKNRIKIMQEREEELLN